MKGGGTRGRPQSEKGIGGVRPLFASVAETITVPQEDHVEAISTTQAATGSQLHVAQHSTAQKKNELAYFFLCMLSVLEILTINKNISKPINILHWLC